MEYKLCEAPLRFTCILTSTPTGVQLSSATDSAVMFLVMVHPLLYEAASTVAEQCGPREYPSH